MADAIKTGGRVCYDVYVGHMGSIEYLEENKGNPRIITSSHDNVKYDQRKPGDVLMTNYVNENVRAARDRGFYVVGVPGLLH